MTDLHPAALHRGNPVLACKLTSLIAIEYLGEATLVCPQRRLEHLQAKTHFQGIGQLPSQHISTKPVDDGGKISKAPTKPDVDNIYRPDPAEPSPTQVAQQLGTYLATA